jgi:DNA-binding transcriptional regulator YiaG
MPRPRVTSQLTTTEVAKQLGIKVRHLLSWVERGVLPPPSFIDNLIYFIASLSSLQGEGADACQ